MWSISLLLQIVFLIFATESVPFGTNLQQVSTPSSPPHLGNLTENVLRNNGPHLTTIQIPQCKCSEFNECSTRLRQQAEKCKLNQTCVDYLKKVAGTEEILQCYETDQQRADEVANCVKQKKGGEFGCTNDEMPKNISIQIIENPIGFQPPEATYSSTNPPNNTFYPTGIVQYSLCVGECINYQMNLLYPTHPQQGMNCEARLGCLMEMLSPEAENILMQCSKDLQNNAFTRFNETCHCLQNAGVAVDCSKPNFPSN